MFISVAHHSSGIIKTGHYQTCMDVVKEDSIGLIWLTEYPLRLCVVSLEPAVW